jgi:hypothetical protein
MQSFLEPTKSILGKGAVDDLDMLKASIVSGPGQKRGRVWDRSRRIAHKEGVVTVAEVSSPRRPDSREDADMPGNLGRADGQLMADNGADGGVNHGGIGSKAGLEGVGAALVIAFFTDHGANETDILHLLGQPFQPLGQVNAFDGRGDRLRPASDARVGVWVEGLELTGTALQPEDDDRLSGFGGVAPLFGSSGQVIAKGSQPGGPGQSGNPQEISTIYIVGIHATPEPTNKNDRCRRLEGQ